MSASRGWTRDGVIWKLPNGFQNIEIPLSFPISISFQKAGICQVLISSKLSQPIGPDNCCVLSNIL